MRRIFFVTIILAIIMFLGYRGLRWYRRVSAPPPPPPISNEITIRILEGWTEQEIAEYLYGAYGLPVTAFQKAVYAYPKSPTGKKFLGRITSVEGYLFPDTYRIYKNATALDVLEKMTANFDARVTPEIRSTIRASGFTLHEGVTLASIIEKEVPGASDRRIVADIFLKRLRAGMALQADSTVNYITKKGMSRATIADTKIDSPYNTYRHRGLPPGPIGNPGLDAIRAVGESASTPYWYFLTTEDGRVIYAKDFDEHKRNRERYLD